MLVSNLSFRDPGVTIVAAPGTYDLEVRVAGTDSATLSVPGVELFASINVTVFAIGLLADESLGVLPVVDENPIFIRGDSNSDRNIDIGDPVATLNFLFTAFGQSLNCRDAADANDDGHVLISDPVYTLTYVFLGGPQPPAPFPAPGADASPDAIGCEEPTGI